METSVRRSTHSAQVVNAQPMRTPIGQAHEVPMQYFLQHVLPPLHHDLDASQILRTLKSTRNGTYSRLITLRDRWRGFPVDPAQSKDSTTRVLQHLLDITKGIVGATGLEKQGVEPTLRFLENTSTMDPALGTRPDVSLVHGSDSSWRSIAACGAYTKNDSVSDIREVDRFCNFPNLQNSVLYPLEHRENHVNFRWFHAQRSSSPFYLWFHDRKL